MMKQANAPSELDNFDRAILRILQVDATTAQREIGEKVNLSAPSVQRRIKRMIHDGIITSQAAIIDPGAVGLPLTILVEVELKAETGGRIDDVKRCFQNAPEVQQCYYVTGEADFILVIIVASMAEYETLTQRLFFNNDNVRKFKTFVGMDRTKVGMALKL